MIQVVKGAAKANDLGIRAHSVCEMPVDHIFILEHAVVGSLKALDRNILQHHMIVCDPDKTKCPAPDQRLDLVAVIDNGVNRENKLTTLFIRRKYLVETIHRITAVAPVDFVAE
jgi:hypothetical protein